VESPTSPTLADTLSGAMAKKQKWPSESPQSQRRDELLTKVFISTSMTTRWLDNPDVKKFLHAMEEKYDVPGE